MSVRIIITGGTFDKHYDELQGTLTFKDTHLPEIIRDVRITVPVELEINQLVDSLEMEMANRIAILESCRNAPEDQIVIVHGTDTMSETARVLGEAHLDKRIVLTGAMVPYAVTHSDAAFNLGCSISAVQLVEPGVYVVMNGRVFAWDRVRKDKENGVFEETDDMTDGMTDGGQDEHRRRSVAAARASMTETIFPDGLPRLWCPLLTHYREDGLIDTERIAAHIAHLRQWVPAFLAPGSTGDGWEMTPDETETLLTFLLDEAQRQEFSLMVGVLRTERGTVPPAIGGFLRRYTNGSGDPGELARHRVCGFTVTAPKGADLEQESIRRELTAIAATGVPLAIYQLPQITENEMSPDTVADLVGRFSNVYLLKDTSGRDEVAVSGVNLDNLFLVRGAEGDYARWSKAAGGYYDGFLLSSANCFAESLDTMLQHLQEGRLEPAEDISRRVAAVIGEVFDEAGKLPFGNHFANGNKAIDHHFAWGHRAASRPAPMTHCGERLPRALLDLAGDTLRRHGFDPGRGYL